MSAHPFQLSAERVHRGDSPCKRTDAVPSAMVYRLLAQRVDDMWLTRLFVYACSLGATVSVPCYIPLPAYNIRRGGAFSAVLEGASRGIPASNQTWP